jgi:diguanylate cyclase (GGDEF)-like protein
VRDRVVDARELVPLAGLGWSSRGRLIGSMGQVMIKTSLRMVRGQAVLVLVLALGLAAAGAITLLERHVDASRRSQAEVAALELHLVSLENAPISATQGTGRSAGTTVAKVEADSRAISSGLRALLASSSPPSALLRVPAAVRNAESALQRIFSIGAGSRSPSALTQELPAILTAVSALEVKASTALSLLSAAGQIYNQRATQARREASFGSIAAIFLLLSVFVVFYRRAWTARAANVRLLEASRDEAITDPLTGIGNRRAFKRDLQRLMPAVTLQGEMLVAMFDLDRFKQYNDTFGHAAGDALLTRLAGSLNHAVGASASAYRMGGDEFCVLALTGIEAGDQLVHAAVQALTDAGDGWSVGCSWGTAWMPSEATSASDALRLADERMYAQKTSRATAGHQASAALVQVLIEQDSDLSTRVDDVARLAAATAQELGVPEAEIARIRLGAQLHDIGKTAIPESILGKFGPLDESEWEYIRRHTVIGERIITAAPSLAHTASLVRSSHERVDGDGYPDRLAGTEIPLGSRIIAVCDAYGAMVSRRPYRDPMTASEALAELRRCAGAQFDPDVVNAFCAIAPDQAAFVGHTASSAAAAIIPMSPPQPPIADS